MPPVENGKTYWRSLAERSDAPEFRRHEENEFAELLPEGLLTEDLPAATRRRFLTELSHHDTLQPARLAWLANLIAATQWEDDDESGRTSALAAGVRAPAGRESVLRSPGGSVYHQRRGYSSSSSSGSSSASWTAATGAS